MRKATAVRWTREARASASVRRAAWGSATAADGEVEGEGEVGPRGREDCRTAACPRTTRDCGEPVLVHSSWRRICDTVVHMVKLPNLIHLYFVTKTKFRKKLDVTMLMNVQLVYLT